MRKCGVISSRDCRCGHREHRNSWVTTPRRRPSHSTQTLLRDGCSVRSGSGGGRRTRGRDGRACSCSIAARRSALRMLAVWGVVRVRRKSLPTTLTRARGGEGAEASQSCVSASRVGGRRALLFFFFFFFSAVLGLGALLRRLRVRRRRRRRRPSGRRRREVDEPLVGRTCPSSARSRPWPSPWPARAFVVQGFCACVHLPPHLGELGHGALALHVQAWAASPP